MSGGGRHGGFVFETWGSEEQACASVRMSSGRSRAFSHQFQVLYSYVLAYFS
jgi:hypothetical protein